MLIPTNTYAVVGSEIKQADRCRSLSDHAIEGHHVNALAALALRMSYKFDNPNELRDWQNLLNLIVSHACKNEITYPNG